MASCESVHSAQYGTKPEKVDPGPDFDFEKEKPNKAVEATEYRRFTADIERPAPRRAQAACPRA
jgi:hypothetical protein